MKTIINDQPRWKSPIVWMAIVAQVLAILLLTGVINPTVAGQAEQIVAAALQVLVLVGVLNNPSDHDAW